MEIQIPQMRFTTGTALLLGIGARILLDKYQHGTFFHPSHSPTTDGTFHSSAVLVGIWQGIMLHQIVMEMPRWIACISFAIGARFVAGLLMISRRSLMSGVLGMAIGALLADLLAQVWDDESWVMKQKCETCGYRHHRFGYHVERRRRRSRRLRVKEREEERPTSPLEREIKALEIKALAADSQRSRLEEEKKWVTDTGNVARAFQLSWQIKRYEDLVQSFTQEASEKRRIAAHLDLSSPNGNDVNIPPIDPIKPAEVSIKEGKKPLVKYVAVESVESSSETSEGSSASDFPTRDQDHHRPSVRVREYVVEKLGSLDGGVEWTRASYRTRRRLPGETNGDAGTASLSSRIVPITDASSPQ